MYSNGGSIGIYKFQSCQSFDFSLSRSFLRKRMDAKLEAIDLFNGLIHKYDSKINNIRFYQREDQDRRSVSVSLIYRMNNRKDRYCGNSAAQDEINRL